MSGRSKKSQSKQNKSFKPCFITLCFDIPINKTEASRIGEHISTDDAYKTITYEHCPNVALFRDIEKKWPIRGFRAGSTGSINGVCNRLANAFKESHNKYFLIQCKLYRYGVIAYIQKEKPELFALLDRESEIQNLQEAAEQLIEAAIIEKIDLEDIALFFELFGISDNPILSGTLKKAKESDPELLVDMVRTLSNKMDELTDEKNSASSKSSISQKRLEAIESDIRMLQEKLASMNSVPAEPEPQPTDEKSYTDHIKEALATFNNISSSLREDFQSTQQAINDVNEHCKAKLEEQEQVNSKQFSHLRLQFEQLSHQTKSYATQLESLEEKYAALSTAIKAIPETKAIAELLPSSIRRLRIPKKATNITKEEQLAAYYSLRLERTHSILLDRTQALIYHILFLESPLVIVDDYTLFDSWVTALGWQDNVLSYTAAPTWLSRQDWETGVESLLGESDIPRFVVIHNFDLALVQSYLLPTLHQRFLCANTLHSPATLILVPSEIQIQTEYPDVLQYGTGIEANDFERLDREERQLKSYINEVKLGLQRSDETFVNIETLKKWRSHTQDSTSEIHEILRAAPIEIPQSQKHLVAHLYNTFQRCLDKEEALLAALYHSTKLWCRAKHDEAMAERFFELATIMTSGQVTY